MAPVSGVYKIRNKVNGKHYVGSSQDIAKRWREHRRQLRDGCHHSVHLQRSWDKRGEDAFSFEMIEEVPPNDLITREQHWLDTLQAADQRYGYNIARMAGSQLGFKHDEKSKEKMRAWDRSKLPQAVMVTYKGVTQSRAEHAKAVGLDPVLVAHRMQQGWTVEDAMETPVFKARTITWKGKSQSVAMWAKETGINEKTIYERLYTFGWSVEDTLTHVSRKSAEFNGETRLYSEWARKYGLRPNTLLRRLNNGWTLERALTEPARVTKPKGQGRKKGGRAGPAPLMLTAFGKTQSLEQWALEYGIERKTLWSRIRVHGWTIEKALTVEVKPGRTPNSGLTLPT